MTLKYSTGAEDDDTDRPLIRPSILSDEWWQGYVARVLGSNGVRFNSMISIESYLSNVRTLVTYEQLISHQVGPEGAFGYRWFGRYLLPSLFVRANESHVPICHSCFADSNHIRMTWRLRTTTVCAQHGVFLNDCCPLCGLRWRIREICRGECQCGFDLQRTDHQRVAQLHDLLGAATDFDATVYYEPHRYVTEYVRDDPNSRKVSFSCFWAYVLNRLDCPDLSAEVVQKIQDMHSSEYLNHCIHLGSISCWTILPQGLMPREKVAKALQIVNEIASSTGHNFGLLGVLPVARWIKELEERVDVLNTPITLIDTKIKNRELTKSILESALSAVSRYFPERSASGATSLEVFHERMRALALPKLPRSGLFVSFTSREMSLNVLKRGLPNLWDGVFDGSIWVYTDYRSSGFTRYHLDRHTYWKWRADSQTICTNSSPQEYVRDLYGYAHRLKPKPIRGSSPKPRKPRHKDPVEWEVDPDQLSLFL